MKFSIITPSFRSSKWLKLCIASVADQEGVELEHIIQDSCSDDGTLDWLPQDPRVRAFIEKDAGMYDAVNRGFRRAQGDILAYLNCDEQYLPGALKSVEKFFEANPQVEIALAGTIVVEGNGDYNCHRGSMVPHPRHIWFRFPVLTSSLFVRRQVFEWKTCVFDKGHSLICRSGCPFAFLSRSSEDEGLEKFCVRQSVPRRRERRGQWPLVDRCYRE